MPVKYVGYPSRYLGKYLLWLLSNLKDFGVGRVVTRSIYERYPEPTFYVIKRVQPAMDDKNIWGDVYVEEWFRGCKLEGERLLVGSERPDYRLIPKSEEAALFEKADKCPKPTMEVLPRTRAFSPLLRNLVLRDLKARGGNVSKEPELELVYKASIDTKWRVAKEGETPTKTFSDRPALDEKFLRGIRND